MITTKVISSKIGSYNWVQYTPDKGTGPWPVLIMFPGAGQTGNDPNQAYVYGPLASAKNGYAPDMVLIFAQTPYPYGTYNNSVALSFLRSVMQEITNGKYPIDINRIYLTGLSYGADHIFYYIQKEDPAYYIPIAAIAPMSMQVFGSIGSSPNDTFGGNDDRFKSCPIWGFCGTQDSFYSPMHRFVTALAPAAGCKTKWTEWVGGHSGCGKYYDPNYRENGMNIEEWLLQYSLAPVVAPLPVVAPAKTIVSMSTVITYSDKTTETITRP